jgi:hypothetical protein
MKWIIRAHSRFRSQAFTTSQRFPSKSKFCDLVSCRSRLGFSLQSVPLTGIARPFQGRFASLRFSTDVPNGRHLGLITAGFIDARAVRRSCQSPPTTMGSLSTHPRARFPVSLDPSHGTHLFRQLHPLRSLDPPASPFTPSRSCPQPRGRSSLGFFPL